MTAAAAADAVIPKSGVYIYIYILYVPLVVQGKKQGEEMRMKPAHGWYLASAFEKRYEQNE